MTYYLPRHRWLCLLASTLLATTVHAQPPAAAPNPAAPTVAQPFPMGVQRGTTLDLNLTGTNLNEPTGVLASFPAKITIPTENNNGKEAAKLLVKLEVPKDAPLGWHTLRVATTRGISNFRLFCIDDLPQIVEKSDNKSLATAQEVPAPWSSAVALTQSRRTSSSSRSPPDSALVSKFLAAGSAAGSIRSSPSSIPALADNWR